PIIQSIKAGNNPVKEANAGFSVEPENAKEIVNAIFEAYDMPREELEALGMNGHKYGLENHSFEKLTKKLISTFE
ncbi:MAG: hypothetical protein QNK57_08840, partial [Flavobacteriales bacterium]